MRHSGRWIPVQIVYENEAQNPHLWAISISYQFIGTAPRRRRRADPRDKSNGSGPIDLCFGTWPAVGMPRPPRAGEAGGLYHALNRVNARARIFHNAADFEDRIGCVLARSVPSGGVGQGNGACEHAPYSLESTAKRLGLASTLRPRGRPQVRFRDESENKES